MHNKITSKDPGIIYRAVGHECHSLSVLLKPEVYGSSRFRYLPDMKSEAILDLTSIGYGCRQMLSQSDVYVPKHTRVSDTTEGYPVDLAKLIVVCVCNAFVT